VEGPVKERLTGALILVALLVIVVPEMLSGPGEERAVRPAQSAAGPPLRTYSLQLDPASNARSQDQSALSPKGVVEAPVQDESAHPAPQTEPAPKTPEVAAPEVAEQPAAPAPPVAAPKPAAEQKPPPVAAGKPAPLAAATRTETGGQWWAQLGSFASRDNAERLTRELRAAGYSVNLARVASAGKELYRVRAGPEPTRDAAARLQARLAAAGHKSSLVAP
jgi:DedD protein